MSVWVGSLLTVLQSMLNVVILCELAFLKFFLLILVHIGSFNLTSQIHFLSLIAPNLLGEGYLSSFIFYALCFHNQSDNTRVRHLFDIYWVFFVSSELPNVARDMKYIKYDGWLKLGCQNEALKWMCVTSFLRALSIVEFVQIYRMSSPVCFSFFHHAINCRLLLTIHTWLYRLVMLLLLGLMLYKPLIPMGT